MRGQRSLAGKVIAKRLVVDLPGKSFEPQKRRERGPEREAGDGGIEERLDAHPVARREQHPLVRVPDRECEHPVQARHHALAPCGESLQQYLGVGLGHENMAGACELLPQIAKIVNFTVENDRVAPIGGAHGLLPRNQIDHGQASVAENGVAQVQQRTVVGPTRAQGIERSPGAVTPRRAYQAEDSAHGLGMPRVFVRVVPSKQVFVIAGSEQS